MPPGAVEVVEAAEVEALTPQLLPCSVQYTGRARVSTYFKPEPLGADPAQLTARFRGRWLEGQKLRVPDGYTGSVLVDSNAASIADGETRRWLRKAAFDELVYYKHDEKPVDSDQLRKCMRFLDVASVLHAELPPRADAVA